MNNITEKYAEVKAARNEMLCDDCVSDERKQAQYTAHADLHATAATMLSLLESARKLKKEKTQ